VSARRQAQWREAAGQGASSSPHVIDRHCITDTSSQNPEQLTSAINIVVSRASAEAIARIESLGGSVTTRFYSPTSIKRVLRGDSHPTVSLQSSSDLISLASASNPEILTSPILSSLQSATADDAAKKEAMAALMKQLGAKYKYRLPDATARKDIEYYRDPAHRGYLSYMVKHGESPSLFFKPPGEAKDRKKQSARRDAAKASADNKLF
jgi:large subunit ribosomal protein L15